MAWQTFQQPLKQKPADINSLSPLGSSSSAFPLLLSLLMILLIEKPIYIQKPVYISFFQFVIPLYQIPRGRTA